MDKKTELVICLGSSCFARGNRKLVSMIQGFILENRLEDKVNFKGNHCFGKCSKGPVLKIGDKYYEHLDETNILEILRKELY